MKRRSLIAIASILVIFLIFLSSCASDQPPSGLPSVYGIAQQCVKDNLISPTTAQFPEYQDTFVKYNTSVLEDLGQGQKLEYRVYDVKAYVDSQNTYGAMVRSNFWVQVYSYVDDYNSPQFGEQGVHKGIKDHYYCTLQSLG